MIKLIDWRCPICNEVRIWDGEGEHPLICQTCTDKGPKQKNEKKNTKTNNRLN